ncbi:hypothetical protein CIHG_10603 [Coccidioides immitis H538.4]|uniref:Uncharacterized protein n=1 Tax=Coccidioides immitis H538.4 TaxID=396776 RepID=A0A0P6QDN8_COCIT|nr:hypothetical protein CIHG_10603 [Coccidioides immitis H538.4]
MDSLRDALNTIALKPELAPLLAILKSARNGAVYGSKVRFPHALVYGIVLNNLVAANR